MQHSNTKKNFTQSSQNVNTGFVHVPAIDPQKLAAALSAALRILRNDPTATVTVAHNEVSR